MELKLEEGRYVPAGEKGLASVSGEEERVQRLLMKLQARRGGFAPLPEYGSRFYLLHREPPSHRDLSALQYAVEALSDERGVVVESAQCREGEDGVLLISLFISMDGRAVTLETSV